MKENDNEGRLVFKDGELIMIHEKEPVLQVGIEKIENGKIVSRKIIYDSKKSHPKSDGF